MSLRRLLSRVRWRLVLPTAIGLVLLALALIAAQTHYSLLSQAGRRDARLLLLTTAWWTEQFLFWAVLACTLVAVALALRARTRRPQRNASAPLPPDPTARHPQFNTRRSWLVSALITVALLQLVGAVDLWLAGRPATLPKDLPPPAAGQFRIAAIGGSSAAGFPYERRHAFPALVGWQLQQLFPDREVVVENLARRGYTLEAACRELNELEAMPHVLLVYSGHNEFLMRYRLDRTPDERLRLQPSLLARALARRIEALRRPEATVDNLQLRDIRRPLFDRPVASVAEWSLRERNFRTHLEATVRWCRRNGVLPILIIPATNEAGFEPARSYLPRTFPADKQRQLREIYAKLDPGPATVRERTNKPLANARGSDLELLIEARQLCPSFAMTWFLLGRSYERSDRFDQARHAYQQALAYDGFPWHATPFAYTYRDVAAQYNVSLIDARDVLRPLVPHGILDDHLFHDVLHPSLTAHLAVADAVVNELRRSSPPDLSGRWPADRTPDPDRLANYLQLTPDLWARVCDQVAKAQLGVPPPRFEAELRARKAARYTQAAARLRAGAAPSSMHLPGIGLQITAASANGQ